MTIKKLGIDRNCATYDELKSQHTVSQGWPAYGDLSFLCDKKENLENYLTRISYDTQSGRNAFRQLFREIGTGDIILAFEGNTIKGIAEIPPNYIYFYNVDDDVEDYRNSLFPVNWVDWKIFCKDSSMQIQGGQGVKGIENSGLQSVNKYITDNWESFKKENKIAIQPPECDIKLNLLLSGFEQKKISSKIAYINKINNEKNMEKLDKIKDILLSKKNLILQGAPGTGKTYNTVGLALKVCGIDTSRMDRKDMMKEYSELTKSGQIAFTTFHQTMDYDDFIEGLKPQVDDGKITYEIEDGIFKKICTDAEIKDESNFDETYDKFINHIQEEEYYPITSSGGALFHVSVNSKQNLILYTGNDRKMNGVLTKEKIRLEYFGQGSKYWVGYNKGVVNELYQKFDLKQPSQAEKKNYVLIIDEINRGNVSKIFGELITLLEADKRGGEENCIPAQLSYSKQPFSVPSNLYIIGTMNTTDRSVGTIDYAVRRRFAFVTLDSSWDIVASTYADNEKKKKAQELFIAVQNYIKKTAVDMDVEDLMVGHSYFMNNGQELNQRWEFEILPLLNEYYKDGICSKSPLDNIRKKSDTNADKKLYMEKFINEYLNQ